VSVVPKPPVILLSSELEVFRLRHLFHLPTRTVAVRMGISEVQCLAIEACAIAGLRGNVESGGA
jgi:predicted DNA-binding protein (UPF0251 family)